MPVLITNVVLVEQVFSVDVIFRDLTRSIGTANVPLILGMTAVGALLIALTTLLFDLVLLWLDPRVARERDLGLGLILSFGSGRHRSLAVSSGRSARAIDSLDLVVRVLAPRRAHRRAVPVRRDLHKQDQVIIMSRISRLVVLVTSVAAVAGAMAGTASAVTWDVGGTGTFTATGSQGTLTTSTGNVVCPFASVTGTYTTGSFAGATYGGITGTITIQGCLLAGIASEVTCGYQLTAGDQPTATTLTTGFMDLTCGWTISGGLRICHLDGRLPWTYHDRTGLADTLTIATSSNLRTTAGSTNCPLGNNDVGHFSPTVITVTSNGGNGPHIVRTA